MEITQQDIQNYIDGNANMALDAMGILSEEKKHVVELRKDICNGCDNLKENKCSLCGCPFPNLTYAMNKNCEINKW